MRHGIGTVIYSDGSLYHGEFRANMKHGSGQLTDRDGGVFSGSWEANIPIGKGTFKLHCGEGPSKGPTDVRGETRVRKIYTVVSSSIIPLFFSSLISSPKKKNVTKKRYFNKQYSIVVRGDEFFQ
jgi:hypothetical protein